MRKRKRSKDEMARDVAIAMVSDLSNTAKYFVAKNVIWQWTKINLKCKWACPSVSAEVFRMGKDADLTSKAVRDEIGITFDHVVPIKVLIDELEAAKDDPCAQRTLLDNYAIACLITNDENKLLNSMKYKQRMPDDWKAGDSALARYDAVGIILRRTSGGGCTSQEH